MEIKSYISYILTVLAIALCLVSCQQEKAETIPTDIEGKKAYLKNREKEMRTLEAEIASLKDELKAEDPSMTKAPKLVTVDTIKSSTFQKYTTLQGNIISDEMINASSEIGGRILDIYVQEGQAVKRGQLIAKIDLETVNKQIEELQTSLELAKTLYQRQKSLWDQNIGSEVQYLQAKNSKERIEKSIESISFQLSKQNVYSPSSGVIDREFRQPGEVTSPGGPIVQILNTNKVKVVVDAPEDYLSIIKKGDYVDINIPALSKDVRARVTQIGRMIDPANRTFKVEVNLNNRNGELKPNLMAEMKIKESEIKDAIVLSSELVQEEVSGKRYVYVVKQNTDGDTICSKRYVETGDNSDNGVIINYGLRWGEVIVDDGARSLLNNEVIKIKS